MNILNITIFILNVILLYIITQKYIKFNALIYDLLNIKSSIEISTTENNRIVELILNELEEKIAEGKKIAKILNEKTMIKETNRIKETNKINEIKNTNVIDLKRKGMSVQEIAQKLNMPQGEIRLELNLYEKKNDILLRNCK